MAVHFERNAQRGHNPRQSPESSLGLAEQTVFPEIDFDKLEHVQGMDITFVTTARTDEEGWFLLKQLGMPFRESGE